MMQRNTNKFFFAVALAVGVVGALVMFTGDVRGQAEVPPADDPPPVIGGQAEGGPDEPEAAFQVGIYNPQAAFQAHPAHEKLMNVLRTTQSEMQEAREAGDQQKVSQLHQKYEQARNEAVEKFERDVEKVLPEVAEATNVKAIVMEIVYTADDVQTKDVTPRVIDGFDKDEEKEEEEERESPPAPQWPGQQR